MQLMVVALVSHLALGNPKISVILTLNGTNHKQWVKALMMNLTIMKMDLALRTTTPHKPVDNAVEKDRKSYDEWEYSNRCCLMIMRYHMDESIRDSICKTENAKDFLIAIEKKYAKFSKNEYLNMLHSTFYDGASDVRAHIDKLMGYYHKLKAMIMNLGQKGYVCFVMKTIPSQFNSIRSSYNAQKEQWSVEEMIDIIAKKEE